MSSNIEKGVDYSCGVLARMPETISSYEQEDGKLRVERKEGVYLFNAIAPNHWVLESFEPKPTEGRLLSPSGYEEFKGSLIRQAIDSENLDPTETEIAIKYATKVSKETTAKVFGDILHLLETTWAYTEFAEIAVGAKGAGLVKKVITKVIDGVKALKSKEGI